MSDSQLVKNSIEEIIGDRFGRYSKYIIQERALPDARDGLKPVQRRIIYGMGLEGNTHDKPYRKSAKTVGIVMGNYHPHGDSSIYDAMVRLSQPWKSNHTLVEIHGNNGSIDDDPAAAMRYTEARLTKLSGLLLQDYKKDTVLMAPNFDDTDLEPTVLPAAFPNLLVNGATGIAAGYATNIPPHNMGEIIDAVVYRMNYPNCSLDDLMALVKGPDFPTGGIVQGKDGIKEAFQTGKGRVVVRAKTEIKTASNIHQIIVSEIPYDVIKVNLVRKIDEIRMNGDIDGIRAVRDESDRNGLRIVIDVDKKSDPEIILNYLLKHSDLQVYYNYNMVAIVNKRPEQMGLAQLIDAYIAHREEVVLNRSRYDYNRLMKRMHILDGLIKAVSIMDEIIETIRASKNKQTAKTALMDQFDFTELQAEEIVSLRLYRLTSTDVKELKEEYQDILLKTQELSMIIEEADVLKQLIISELMAVKEEFAHKRQSVIEDEVEEIELDKTDLISNEDVIVAISKDGYIKRVSLRSYSASTQALPGLKEDDVLIGYQEVELLDTLLIFLDNGEYVYLPVYDLDEYRWRDLGVHLSSYVSLPPSSNIVSVMVISDFSTNACVTQVSKNGMIKKTQLSEYDVVRYSRSLVGMNLKDGDQLVSAFITYDHDELFLQTRNGYMLRYSSDEINETGVRTQGVIGANLSEDEIVSAGRIDQQDVGIVVLSEEYGLKRLRIEDIATCRRTTMGEKIFAQTTSNPQYVKEARSFRIDQKLNFTNSQGDVTVLDVVNITIRDKDARFSRTNEEIKGMWWVPGFFKPQFIVNQKLTDKKVESIAFDF